MAAYRVKDVMTKKVITVNEDLELEKIVDLILEKKINRIPVVDKEHRLIGIITRSDILRHII